MKNTLKSLVLVLALVASLYGQATTSSTTLGSAVAKSDLVVYVASVTGITGPTSLNTPTTLLFVDKEEMPVLAIGAVASNGYPITVQRGGDSTPITAHISGAKVWFGPQNYFRNQDPSGACTGSNYPNMPQISVSSGIGWTCPSSGPNAGVWAQQFIPQGYNFTDGAFYLSASACVTTVSGNSTGTQGLTTAGGNPVVQAQTSNTGTNTHTYLCTINVPTRLTSGKGVSLTDATFFYGVQTTTLGTQAATLASGTMNSSVVFSYINMPTAATGETASTVTPVRADSGSLLITPAVASANVATTTAGAYYSVKFTPSAPIAFNTDLQQLLLTVTLQNTATSATITNSPGVLIHYIDSPL